MRDVKRKIYELKGKRNARGTKQFKTTENKNEEKQQITILTNKNWKESY